MVVDGWQLCYEILEKDSPLYIAKEKAHKRKKLWHYTSFGILKKILESKQLKFNRIDKVNDRLESKIFGDNELSHLVYISCFSKIECESIPMWDIYGKNKHGVRIGFQLKCCDFSRNFIDKQGETKCESSGYSLERIGKKNIMCADWYYDVEMKDVVYDINQLKNSFIRQKLETSDDEIYNLTYMGAIKRREWQYEEECRLVAYLKSTRNGVCIPEIDAIYVPIKYEQLQSITITFNPWMEEKDKADVKDFIESIKELKEIDIVYQNSVLEGELKEELKNE